MFKESPEVEKFRQEVERIKVEQKKTQLVAPPLLHPDESTSSFVPDLDLDE
jgi:hypothetical protein